MHFLRTLGALSVLIGAGLDAILILSKQSRFVRILCLIFWWPGFTVFIAACKSLCLLLHLRDVRELRPWEMFPSDKDAESAVKDVYSPSPQVMSAGDKESGVAGFNFVGQHSRKNTNDSTGSDSTPGGSDPLRKPSMRTFGPKNDYSDMKWYHLYSKRSVFSKIMDQTTPVQNPTLRAMQNRTIFYAVLWGGLLTAALVVGSLMVPPMKMMKMM